MTCTKIAYVVAGTTSILLGVLAFHVYEVYNQDDPDVLPHNLFFPLWFSMDWPCQRTYPFPDHIQYVDRQYYAEILRNPDYTQKLRDENAQYQILDRLFRLKIIRDKFGIPLTLTLDESDTFSMWVEPKYPTFHGIDVGIGKKDGRLYILCNWHIHYVNLFEDINGMIDDIGSQFDSMVCSDKRTVVDGDLVTIDLLLPSSLNDPNKVAEKRDDREYRICVQGTYHLHNTSGSPVGVLCYTGVIDFTHLGINRGFRVKSLQLKTTENGKRILYKVN